MPQFAALGLKDSANATLTFNPASLEIGGNAIANHRPAGAIDLQSTLVITPKSNRELKTNTINVKLTIPVIRAVNGENSVVENIIADLRIRIPYVANTAERDNVIALLRSAMFTTDAPSLAPVLRGTEALW